MQSDLIVAIDFAICKLILDFYDKFFVNVKFIEVLGFKVMEGSILCFLINLTSTKN